MQLLKGMITIDTTVTMRSTDELMRACSEIIEDAEINLGEFETEYREIAEKVEREVSEEQEPILLDEEQERFLIGLALILDA